MFIAKWNNLVNGRSGSRKHESEAVLIEWVQDLINKKSIGNPARQVVKGDDYDPSLVLSEFEDNELGITRTIVSLKAEYEYSIEEVDISSNTAEAKSERLRVASEKAAQFKVFKEFGEKVELYFTALINERNYTQKQKDSIQANADVLAVLGQLKFGRIAMAKGIIDAIVADGSLFFQQDLNTISLLMADFLEDYPLQGQ